jgi:hypothetical protein
MREKRAERQAAKEAREAAKAADAETANGDSPAKKPAAKSRAGGRTRKPPSPGTARTKKAGTRSRSKS